MSKRNNAFSAVMTTNPPKNTFSLSHDVKLSFKMGQLIPTCVVPAMPGDYFNINVENLVRFAPLVSPVMHKVEIFTHFFFVRNKILWPEWDDWQRGESSSAHPNISIGTSSANTGSLGHYIGYKDPASGTYTANILPAAAYVKIWDDWYRSDHLQTEQFTELIAGGNGAAYSSIVAGDPFLRNFEHDYFTAALPSAQLNSAVDIPLVDTTTTTVDLLGSTTGTAQQVRLASDHSIHAANSSLESQLTSGDLTHSGTTDVVIDPNGTLGVNVGADAASITTLRRAFRLQEFLEKQMRGGNRMIEHQLVTYGERIPDYRADRSIYLGGARHNMVISEVLATAEGTSTEVGDFAGHGIGYGTGKNFNHKCTEYGWIIGITSVMPKTAYYQGLERKFHVPVDWLDLPIPDFAHIGEEAILDKELYIDAASPDATFGYIPRYSSWRFENSKVFGDFSTSSLEHFHLARKFATEPSLNGTFLECDATQGASSPLTRIFADRTGDHIWAHVFNNITVQRRLPKFGVPSI
jgi:hypothetical protein